MRPASRARSVLGDFGVVAAVAALLSLLASSPAKPTSHLVGGSFGPAAVLPADARQHFVAIPERGMPRGSKLIDLQTVATGLVSPVQVTHAGDSRLFVVDQIGLVRVIDGGVLRPAPFLDLRSRLVGLLAGYDERGLLSLAFHPAYARNGKLYVYYSAPTTTPGFDHRNVVSEFTVSSDPNAANDASERVILAIDNPQPNHSADHIAFGPDGFLYISKGDGGGSGDRDANHTPGLGNGQDTSTLLGKVLRVDVDHQDPGLAYAIPSGNPFVGVTGARPEIWAYGLRNPFRFAFDRGGSNRLFLADVGQGAAEEIDIITRGGNYGWRAREGSRPFDTSLSQTGYVDPIADYSHADGSAVIGGFVYRGTAIPSLVGSYVFGDLAGPRGRARLFHLDESMPNQFQAFELHIGATDRGVGPVSLKGFGEDAAGELYALVSGIIGPSGTTGQVLKIVPAPTAPALTVATNRANFATGDTLTASLGRQIAGGAGTADLVFGALFPDGDTVLVFTGSSLTSSVGRLSDVSTLRPLTSVDLGQAALVSQPDVLSYTWRGSEPPGAYTLFVAAVTPGALSAGVLAPGSLLAISTATVTFQP